jgi:hypothetical protein
MFTKIWLHSMLQKVHVVVRTLPFNVKVGGSNPYSFNLSTLI